MRALIETLDLLRVARAPLGAQPPDEDEAGGRLDEAVDAEAEQRHAARRQRRRDRDDPLDDVPADREVLEPQAAAEEVGSKFCHAAVAYPRATSCGSRARLRWAPDARSLVSLFLITVLKNIIAVTAPALVILHPRPRPIPYRPAP